MIDDYRQLVAEIADFTGSAPPALLEEDAPILTGQTLDQDGASMYLVGLIGGKDVGKSALVNALVGREITLRTSHGPGTEIVIAYAHAEQSAPLAQLLDREVPGQYRMVTHDVPQLRRQVLLDLPDIDSHYEAHVEVTRRMLRHMLFPIWMQSIEKYADRRPQELLAAVAVGNAPQNFIFCLNKIDQIASRNGESAAGELQRDYSSRIARILCLDPPPRIWMISAINPQSHDLPELRRLLAQQKSEQSVAASRQSAIQRQTASLTRWIDEQDLDHRLESIDRLQSQAEEEVAARLGTPLAERTVPALLDDPAYRLALADQLMQQRISRWPVVNILHVLLGPLVAMLRKRLPIEQQQALAGADELVQQHLRNLDGSGELTGQSVSAILQSTFAFLQQASPQVSRLYAQQKLWEPMPADLAEAELRRRLATTVDRQRQLIRSRLGGGGFLGAIFRVLLVFGAILWFPLLQPGLEAWLAGGGHMLMLFVSLLGVTYLLKNVGFLVIYFIVLWLIVKWDTQRRVDRWLERWKRGDSLDPTLSLTGQVLEWTTSLLEPIRAARSRLADLIHRAHAVRQSNSA